MILHANFAVDDKSQTKLAAVLQHAAVQKGMIEDSKFAVMGKSSKTQLAAVPQVAADQVPMTQDAIYAVVAKS